MKWFKHFSNSHNNNKLTKVRMKYGADGYAIYWYCLELISADLGTNVDINFELKHDAEVIGFNLKVDSVKVEEIMKFMISLNLFESVGGTVTCLRLAKYLEKKNTRNSQIHKIIDKYNNSMEVSATNPDSLPTNRDSLSLSPLDTDTDTDTEKRKKNSSRFTPPSLDEVNQYISEKSYDIDGERFINFYESKNWMVGKNKMTKWKAALSNWGGKKSPAKDKFAGGI